MSKYSFFLFNTQAAWIEGANYRTDNVNLKAQERRLYFNATPIESTKKLKAVPDNGSQICLIQSNDSEQLSSISTSYHQINGEIFPIEQMIDIYLDKDHFSDILSLRNQRLHLTIKFDSKLMCGLSELGEDDGLYKEHPVIWHRISLLPQLEEAPNQTLWQKLINFKRK